MADDPDTHAHTATKLPAQRICTFAETLELLMLEGNRHVVLNVDVKLDNDPEVLYPLMQACIEEFPGWKEDLAPRLILGEPARSLSSRSNRTRETYAESLQACGTQSTLSLPSASCPSAASPTLA